MPVPCAGCDTPLPDEARFCPQCALPVGLPTPAREVALERRQLTVMFCDLVESTALANGLDPEDWSEVLGEYQKVCTEIIEGLSGRVAQYLGDGILVYFGHPQAHEDDAVRAVSAALRVRDALPELNTRLVRRFSALAVHPIRVRIGLHTGPVVVGDPDAGEGAEGLATGDTVNLASRLQGIAAADGVVISRASLRLVRGVFITEALGLQRLRGIREPIEAWAVLVPSGVRNRLRSAELTPLVGREPEVSLLVARWGLAKAGKGRALLLSGEAGIGKSRLIRALHDRLADEAHTWIECHCSPYDQSSAFHPVVGFLEEVIDLRRGDPAERQIEAMELTLRRSGYSLAEVMPLFASLLSIPLPKDYPADPVGPEEMRQRTLEWLTSWLVALCARQPAVIVVENLNWCDPSTLELLARLMERAAELPIFFLFSFRPDFTPPWQGLDQLSLPPLGSDQTVALVGQVAAESVLSRDLIGEIATRADGVPLFAEELTKVVLESEARHHGEGHPETAPIIPMTIQDSLMARIDRLGPAKEVAQLASVLGRSFSQTLLEAVSSLSPPDLASAERELQKAGLLYRIDSASGVEYSFKHALVHDVAYQSLLRRTRRALHATTATVLEERFPEIVSARPAMVARHFEEADLPERAIAYYRRAGEEAAQRSAHAEATQQLRKALALLEGIPDGAHRDELELKLQVAIAVPLIALEGFGDPDVEHAYARAHELSSDADPATRFRVLYGLSIYRQARADLAESVEHGERGLALANEVGNPAFQMLSHQRLGLSHYYAGKPAEALEHLAQAISRYDPAEHRPLAIVYGQDVGVVSQIYAAIVHAAAGPPGVGRERIDSALADARAGGHPHTLAFALGFAGVASQMMQERDRVRAYAEEVSVLAEERGFPLWQGFGKILLGWIHGVLDEDEGASQLIQQGLTDLATTGTIVGGPFFLSLLAEAQWRQGDSVAALETLEAALAFAEAHGSPYWDAELLRLKGEVVGSDGDPQAAFALFELSQVTAEKQGARLLALRAATSAARLLAGQGRNDEARARLEPLVASLSGAGGCPDLTAARELLDA